MAQDKQPSKIIRTIETDQGVKNVYLNEDGLQYIVFSPKEAEEAELLQDVEDAENDFGGPGLDAGAGIKWTIATRKSNCKSGIGFRCGKKYQIHLVYTGQLREGNGQHEDRKYDIWLTRDEEGNIRLTFFDKIAWDWLLTESEE